MVSLGATCALCCSVLIVFVTLSSAGDIVHPDSIAPRRPGCDNNFVLVPQKMKLKLIFLFFYFVFDVNWLLSWV